MKSKSVLKIFLLSLFLMIAVSPLRSYANFQTSSLIGFTAYFFLTIFCLKKFNLRLAVWQILTALILGYWAIGLPSRIMSFQSSLVSLPDSLLQTLGIVCGFLYWRLRSPSNILTASLGCLITVFTFYQGYDYWIHKLNFGTFTGKVEAHGLPAKFEAFDEQKKLLTESDFNAKIALLDFWTTTCGVCFKKFPQVQAVYDKYKNDPSVMILAVNKPIEEDTPNQAFDDIRQEGYGFPVVVTTDEDLAEKFGVKGYPTTFVINRNGQIVYKGDIEGAVKMVDELKANY